MPTDMMRSERGPSGPALLIQQLLGLWERQSRGRKLVAVVALGAVAAALGWGALFDRADRWKVVVTAHHDEEAHECIAALQRQGIAVRANGRDIEVAPGDVGRALEALDAAGLPDAGVGLRSFDDGGIMTTGFAEQVSYKRALQDELARSIKGLAPVDGARVHLAMGRASLFRDRDQRPSASVALRLRPGQPLSAAQVRGIQQLVMGSVEGLRAEDVSVIDHLGNVLQGESSLAGGSQAEIEQAVAGKVRGILERVVGAGKVVVVVSADVDLRKVEETAEIFDGPRGGDGAGGAAVGAGEARGAAPRSAEVGATAPAPAVMAEPSVAPSVAPIAPAVAAAPVVARGSRDGRSAGERRASPSHVVTATRFPGARLARLHLAVVVDYARGADGHKVAPTDAQLAQWTQLARSAAGLDESRGDHLEMQAAAFSSLRPEPGLYAPTSAVSREVVPRWAVGAGAAVLLAIVAVSASLRRRSLRRKLEESERHITALSQEILASERRTAEAQAALRTAHLDPGRRPAAERVNDIVRRDLDSAALVLAAWLGDAERDGHRPAEGERSASAEGRLS